MPYFYLNEYVLPHNLDERKALDRTMNTLAGLPMGYLDTLIDAAMTHHETMDQWCDDWRDENADRLDAFDTPEPEDQPEYEVACDAERRNVADEFHVTVEQLTNLASITALGRDGLAELRDRNELFWSIVEAAGMTIAA
ncbi:TPA: hypothetical protein QDA71_002449 [Burkholderia vietnamiensis]|uniref:hypothetical protein n=1 Tax=Burkholderia TaxID=32008 RepID=UPI000754E682|nr:MULTISPECIES: hypothetical protein [Burkholderia]KVS26815.1 hypothetical protein WK34_13635 [Burkholderia vietnamiensis]MBR8014119.1 hypothetical protein [Burkholderia vietnamiensis]HDR8945456.1 hypothetical protein [Burkholderia vietnamiensis]HDR9040794.1 hypothetical protein [Burkholderia vietnamiensis]HDR9195794.1 hypothetical protein [Burkholderia vietnamiensis]